MILMHQNIPVCEVDYLNGSILNIREIFHKNEMPLGTVGANTYQTVMLANSWAKARTVPSGRTRLDHVTSKLGINLSDGFFISHGVSLTDTYWLKEKEEDVTWEDINFHKNGFDSTFGAVYGNCELTGYRSPDFTTDGLMEKFWVSSAKEPFLIKMDKTYNAALCANEVVAYEISNALEIHHTPYIPVKMEHTIGCMCPCFVKDEETDFVTANQIVKSGHFYGSNQLAEYFCKTLGMKKEFQDMVFLDILLGNTDRHDRNYGILQKKDGTRFGPLFDTGSCLSYSGLSCKEIKTPNILRREVPKQYLPDITLDTGLFKEIIQNTYESFGISEDQCDRAIKEMEAGAQIINKNQNKSICIEMEGLDL